MNQTQPQGIDALTPRELQTLTLVLVGDKQAASVMGVSLHTCRAHWRAVYAKLGVHSRAAAAVALLLSPQCPRALRTE